MGGLGRTGGIVGISGSRWGAGSPRVAGQGRLRRVLIHDVSEEETVFAARGVDKISAPRGPHRMANKGAAAGTKPEEPWLERGLRPIQRHTTHGALKISATGERAGIARGDGGRKKKKKTRKNAQNRACSKEK